MYTGRHTNVHVSVCPWICVHKYVYVGSGCLLSSAVEASVGKGQP